MASRTQTGAWVVQNLSVPRGLKPRNTSGWSAGQQSAEGACQGRTSQAFFLGVYKEWFKTKTGRNDPSETSRQQKLHVKATHPQSPGCSYTWLGMAACAYNSRTQEVTAGGFVKFEASLNYIVRLYPKHTQACCVGYNQSCRPTLK